METNTTCKICGGNAIPSKGLINYHNLRYPHDGSKAEFEDVMEDCLKCENCGHSWINGKEETNTPTNTVEEAARFQYDNVGYSKQDDGTLELYIKGAEVGANWQKEQDEARYKELKESHQELLEQLEDVYRELEFHNWHNSRVGMVTNQKINNAKKLNND